MRQLEQFDGLQEQLEERRAKINELKESMRFKPAAQAEPYPGTLVPIVGIFRGSLRDPLFFSS
jgi:hypothetical protein